MSDSSGDEFQVVEVLVNNRPQHKKKQTPKRLRASDVVRDPSLILNSTSGASSNAVSFSSKIKLRN